MDLFETDIEKIFRLELENRGYVQGKDFATQFPIPNSYVIDIFFPKKRIAIECDGEPFHTSPSARKRDNHKNYILMKRGWTLFRFWGNEIRQDVAACVDQVIKKLEDTP